MPEPQTQGEYSQEIHDVVLSVVAQSPGLTAGQIFATTKTRPVEIKPSLSSVKRHLHKMFVAGEVERQLGPPPKYAFHWRAKGAN